ncbi:MAG: cytochrome c [Opitutaceae bacterium]
MALIGAGEKLFQQLCFACHGLNGQGMVPLGPPLANSEWVLGAESRLIRITLHGVAGPIEVSGTTYQPPNILPEMPALANLDDAQIASVLSYVRRAWGHEAALISPAQVATVRQETAERKTPWTQTQLLEIK